MNQLIFTYQLKKGIFLFVFFLGSLAAFTACSKKEAVSDLPKEEPVQSEISFEDFVEDLKKITALGFDPLSIERTPRGYLVEGDILLTKENLNASFSALSKQQGQYATRYPVAVVRTIKVSLVDATNSPLFSEAFDSTLARMNAVRLPLKFVKEADTSKADMITSFKDLGAAENGSVTLAQASDFVSPEGNPGKYLSFNSHPDAGWRNTSREYITGVWCHEFGHAIGLRHTDYQNRIYSQLLSTGKEFNAANQEEALSGLIIQLAERMGINWDSLPDYQKAILKVVLRPVALGTMADESIASVVKPETQASHIYGTPLSPVFGATNPNTDPASLMLAFVNENNLKFSNYDHIALYGIYGNPAQTALIRNSLSETGEVVDGTKTLDQIVAEVKALGRKD